MKKKIKIEGMSCGHCSGRVTKALNELEEVVEATVDLQDKSAVVELSSDVSHQLLKETVEDVGYDVVSIEII